MIEGMVMTMKDVNKKPRITENMRCQSAEEMRKSLGLKSSEKYKIHRLLKNKYDEATGHYKCRDCGFWSTHPLNNHKCWTPKKV